MNDRRYLLPGIVVISLLIHALEAPHGTTPGGFMTGWAVAMAFTASLWLSNRALWLALRRRLPRVEQTARRLWLTAGLAVVVTTVVSLLLHGLLYVVAPDYCASSLADLLKKIRFNFIPTGIILLLYETVHFFQSWEQSVRRAEQLDRAGTQAQLEALRGQLDPHFLFNNLNTLAALIEPGNEPAQHFVEQLADVYRYVLLSQGQATVPLAEELAFVDTYLALHKVRFRDNLRVEQAIAPDVLSRRVAPLSVQLLVENALKHNVASQQHPLHLRLSAGPSADFLTVENTRRPRTAGLAPGTGTGLANVRRRYELLGATQALEVREEAGTFVVKLPLL